MLTIVLLTISNVFMTFAWYGHLRNHQKSALWLVILVSWLIAFGEGVLRARVVLEPHDQCNRSAT